MTKAPVLTRAQIFEQLDAIATSWGTPKLSQRIRDDQTNTAKLAAMLKRIQKAADRDLNWQSN